MGVIVFASLKGGVGKTSLSINVSHSFSRRGCRTLLIDLDPAGHTSRFFKSQIEYPKQAGADANIAPANDSPLAKLFFEAARSENAEVELPDDSILIKARPDLDVLASGEELRHFLWGRGNQLFARYFPKFIKNLKLEYDHVVIDTPPDFNTLTRNSLAAADVVIVPVDASEMSIFSLEELLLSAQHMERPTWGICRTMVNRKAQKSQRLSTARLSERLDMQSIEEVLDDEFDVEDPTAFVDMLQSWEKSRSAPRRETAGKDGKPTSEKPLFLLRSLIYRSEIQNQLSFHGKTALDSKQTFALAEQYLSVAKEVESLLTSKENDNTGGSSETNESDNFEESTGSGYEMHA